MSSQPEIVVTGMGAVSALGWGVADLWEGLAAGRCGIRPLTRLDASRHRIVQGGEVPERPPDAGERALPAARYLQAAVSEALEGAGLRAEDRAASALVAASNFGEMAAAEAFLGGFSAEASPLHATPPRVVADGLGLGGACVALSLSCASGAAAIGHAADLIRHGRAGIAVAAGYDAISEVVWAGLSALRAMSATALRPFDARRDGTIFAEGAGALVLEPAERARKRRAPILARYLGHGTSGNAHHMTHPDPDGAGMVRPMRAALSDAGLVPEHVQHVNAHATGTPYNDRLETAAIKAVFGAHARDLAVNGVKSMLGHAMGAAGALEAIATVQSLRTGVVPPTISLEEPDPECDLDNVPGHAREMAVAAALSNSAGFGGCNASVVFGRWEGGT